MIRVLSLGLALSSAAWSAEIPDWVLVGIPAVESRSYWTEAGLVYVDQRRGSHGEMGAWQVTRAAFNQVRQRGEQRWRCEVDTAFCTEVAVRYLLWLREREPDWEHVVMAWNAGPHHSSPSYLAAVAAAGEKP